MGLNREEEYDMPRYRVWAETADGSRKMIVNDVIEDYAYFVVQRLEERLHSETEYDVLPSTRISTSRKKVIDIFLYTIPFRLVPHD